jgi:hypothetical protein
VPTLADWLTSAAQASLTICTALPSGPCMSATARLTPSTIALLLIPPLMWAGNAVVGRMMQGAIPPACQCVRRGGRSRCGVWLALFGEARSPVHARLAA